MKYNILLLLIFVGLFSDVLGQSNSQPVISNLKVSTDTTQNIVTFDFDVEDKENDNLEIGLTVSANEGLSYNFALSGVKGDIGANIKPSKGKRITWEYTKSDFSGIKTNLFTAKIIADDKQVSIENLVSQVDSVRLRNNLSFLAKESRFRENVPHIDTCRNWIASEFTKHNLVTTKETFVQKDIEGINIIGKKAGALQDTAVYILDGHYDSVKPSKGADDNGSAVVGMIEALRILSPYQFKKSLKFIGFDLEEEGLLGSAAYTQEQIPVYEKTKGVLNFEMIGYYSDKPNSQVLPNGFEVFFKDATDSLKATQFRGNFITNVSNNFSSPLMKSFESCAKKYVPKLRVINLEMAFLIPDLLRSDHAQFWLNNIPALMLTDGANFRNQNYHTNGDTLGTINFTFMSNVVKAAIATLCVNAEIMNADVKTTEVFKLNNKVNRDKEMVPLVDKFKIYPNPFEDEVKISFNSNAYGLLNIKIYDLQGKLVKQVYQGKSLKGENNYKWDGKNDSNQNVAEGMYVIKVELNNETFTKNVLLSHHTH